MSEEGEAAAPPLVRCPERPFCQRHFHQWIPEHHPSGVTWQARYAVAAMTVVKLAMEDPRVLKLTGGEIAMGSAILSQVAPLCCYLGAVARVAVPQEIARAIAKIQETRPPGS